jgi:autotransporter-associated beta strand protein
VIFNGAIGQSAFSLGITKLGTGTLALNVANGYSGGTTLSAGTLQVGNNSALSTGLLTLNGGTLSSNGTTAYTLSNAVTFGGNVTLGDATNSGALTLSGTGTLNGGETLTINSAVTLSGVIKGSNGSITKAGTGTLILTGSNTYNGDTQVNNGELSLSATGSLNTSSKVKLADNAVYQVTLSSTNAANLKSTANLVETNALGSTATITSAIYGTTFLMQWNARADADTKAKGGFLASDLLTVNDSNSSAYALEISYDGSQLVGPTSKAFVLEDVSNKWILAAGNETHGSSVTTAMECCQESFSTFLSDNNLTTLSNLTNYVGAYGVDTANNTSWVILNSSGTFAVPEPGTLALLVAGFLSLIAYAWRRRKTM